MRVFRILDHLSYVLCTFQVSGNGELPSYSEYTSQSQYYSPTVDNSNFQYGNPFQTGMPTTHTRASSSEMQLETLTSMGSPDSSSGVTHMSAISDVPFTLGGNVDLFNSFRELCSSGLLYQQTFDHNCYEYDFSLEMKFLMEHERCNTDMNWQDY